MPDPAIFLKSLLKGGRAVKIKRMEISGFRSIGEPIVIEFKDMCALVGPNNAGKSNILELINTVVGKDWITRNSFDESDIHLNNNDIDIEVSVDFVEPYQHLEYVAAEPVDVPRIRFAYTKYKTGPLVGQRRLEKECLKLDGKKINVLMSAPKRGVPPSFKPLTSIPNALLESLQVVFIGSDRKLKYQLPNARNSMLGILFDDIDADFRRSDNTIDVKKPDGETAEVQRISRFKQAMSEAIRCLRTDEFVALEGAIKANVREQLGFSPDIPKEDFDIHFEPPSSDEFYKSLKLIVKEMDFEINAEKLGGGFQNAIIMAVMRTFEERRKRGAIFLVEEPELMLHPQMQRSLYKTFRKIAETNQVIYVTHSPNFVTVPDFDEIALIRKEGNRTKVVQSSLLDQAKAKEKFRKELNAERSEMFFATKILFVEGPTEKLALPEYAFRLGKDFDRAGTSIIEVGGKRSLPDYVDLALSFGIPVALVYDTDSSDFKDRRDEEVEFNTRLEAYRDKGVEVWSFEKNYEKACSNFWGDNNYTEYRNKYGGHGKPARARLIANDESIPVPNFVGPIVDWLSSA